MHLQWIFNNIQIKNSDSPSLLLDSPQYPKKIQIQMLTSRQEAAHNYMSMGFKVSGKPLHRKSR